MSNKYIDLNLTNRILANINNGLYDNIVPVTVKDIPGIDGTAIIDRSELKTWSGNLDEICGNLRKINPGLRDVFGTAFGKINANNGLKILTLTLDELRQIGVQLYPYVSYGILNGGSSTSYADSKKNNALNPELMKLYSSLFEKSSKKTFGKAKGITPAYTNPDGSSGPSFIELKLRALLIENLRYRQQINGSNEIFSGDAESKSSKALFPMFQMTSIYNDAQIQKELEKYKSSPLLKDLIEVTGTDMTKILTGIQPMLAALTHSSVGRPRQIYTDAYGRDGEMLPLPGGHGQNFIILSEIYRYLYNDLGKRFIYICNVDNIASMPDPVSIALTAMSGCQASFEFAFRTPVDVKGGILIRDKNGKLNCADIGPAISKDEVDRREASGEKILYNCATGLFNLEYLTTNLDQISNDLPMRITDQDKDAGLYAQAEQVTWEIIGMLDKPLIIGVNKYSRYLAAKLLLESLMTSGLLLEEEGFPSHEDPSLDFRRTAEMLYQGLRSALRTVYGMIETGNGWKAASVGELKTMLKEK